MAFRIKHTHVIHWKSVPVDQSLHQKDSFHGQFHLQWFTHSANVSFPDYPGLGMRLVMVAC